MIDYSKLNTEQHEAVFSDHQRILCLAGAGTGKTQVLTRRIARLWEAGVKAESMLALTFTRAAGAEMKERVIELVGDDGKNLFCNTFHSFCMDFIREFAEQLGYEPDFSVYDDDRRDELLKTVLLDLDYKVTIKQVNSVRSGKTAGMSVAVREEAKRAAKEYEYRLRRYNALDFDGLINTVKTALIRYPAVCEIIKMRYTHIFVDEFQDTDHEQWEIVKCINSDNLFVVGDDFQSIYAFRGSDIEIILGLANNPDWQVIKLERNYRSSVSIIEAANALIKHNNQTKKVLITEKIGVDIEYREPSDDDNEIKDIIERLNLNLKTNKTTAILARYNLQIKRAKDILSARNIPCETTVASDSPFSGKGARELMAWVAAFANPRDDEAFRRIASSYPNMSKSAIHTAESAQLAGEGTFSESLRGTTAGAQLMDFYDKQRDFFSQSIDIASGLNNLSSTLGITDRAALNEISRWQRKQQALGEETTPATLLDYERLASINESSSKERDASKIHLMTVHGSKGLEFDEVFIIGATQGTFPSKYDNIEDLKEERRLFYVAITRARDYLNISRPLTMTGWDRSVKKTEQSQFIKEALPPDVM